MKCYKSSYGFVSLITIHQPWGLVCCNFRWPWVLHWWASLGIPLPWLVPVGCPTWLVWVKPQEHPPPKVCAGSLDGSHLPGTHLEWPDSANTSLSKGHMAWPTPATSHCQGDSMHGIFLWRGALLKAQGDLCLPFHAECTHAKQFQQSYPQSHVVGQGGLFCSNNNSSWK